MIFVAAYGGFFRRYWRGIALGVGVVLILLLGLYIRGWLLLGTFEKTSSMEGATLLADNGEIIATLGQGPTRYIPIEDIPQNMKDAIIAIEDRWFYEHPGFNPVAILRALYVDIRARKKVLGASTITQQLAKNLFLTPAKTWSRKIEELILAIVLEQRYTKNQILELYLNRIYFGEGSYGIEAAARGYLGKSAKGLTLADSALLAAIPRSPAAYDPYVHPEAALERRNLVLDRMAALDMISEDERADATGTSLELSRRERGPAPYFIDYVKKQLEERYGSSLVYRGGLRIHTSLNLNYQEAANAAIANQKLQGALIAVNPHTGGIQAMVGGRNYIESQFNRAVRAYRQPGSAFKPFIYAAALESGWQLNTLVEDTPREYAGYTPGNWASQYWGPVTMKHAVAVSLNNAAVWTLNEVGIDRAMGLARQMGIESLTSDDRNLALALGGLTKGVTPLELAGAFLPFANGGTRYEPWAIQKVLDTNGRILQEHLPTGAKVLEETTAYLVTDMLRAVLEYGTAKNLPVQRPAAGKTGTTDERISLWFAGYTPSIVAVVYLGDDQQEPLPGYGSSLAGPVWAEFINTALADEPPWEFSVPRNIITGVPIDIFSGLLAGPGCEWIVDTAFIQGTEPTEYAPCSLDQNDSFPTSPRPQRDVTNPNDTESAADFYAPITETEEPFSLPEAATSQLPEP